MPEEIYIEENGKYLKNNPSWHVEDSPWKASQILKMLARNPINPSTIAEIGCGAGEILKQLHDQLPQQVQLTGYDISIDAITLAKERANDRLSFLHENLLDTNEHFDLLLMMDVFEHVEDYIGFVRACTNKASHTIFHIPLDVSVYSVLGNNMMHARKTVGHLHYFTKDSALATLKDAGFEIVDHFYTNINMDLQRKAKSKISYIPKKLMLMMNGDLAVKIIGGFSLLVLAK